MGKMFRALQKAQKLQGWPETWFGDTQNPTEKGKSPLASEKQAAHSQSETRPHAIHLYVKVAASVLLLVLLAGLGTYYWTSWSQRKLSTASKASMSTSPEAAIDAKNPPPALAQKPSAIERPQNARPDDGLLAPSKLAEAREGSDPRQEILIQVEHWRRAWELSAGHSGDIPYYDACYSDSFQTNGMDKKTWVADKTKKNQLKTFIAVTLQDIKVTVIDKARAEVSFIQKFHSSNYEDVTHKRLRYQKDLQGWRIIAEETGDS